MMTPIIRALRDFINVQRGGLYDTRDGASLSVHIWFGPLGFHVFRRPFGVVPDWQWEWRR